LANPYEPPKAPMESSQTRPGSRWRIVPSSFLVLFGAFMALLPLITIVVELVRPRGILDGLAFVRPLDMLIIGTSGCLWIVSGAMFWKRSWWSAVILLLVGYAIGIFAGMQI
jgi:hypothetical protein